MIKYKMIHNNMDDMITCHMIFSDAVSWMTALKNMIASPQIQILKLQNNLQNKLLRNAIVTVQITYWDSPVIVSFEMILGDLHKKYGIQKFFSEIYNSQSVEVLVAELEEKIGIVKPRP